MFNNKVFLLGGTGFLGSNIIKTKPDNINLWFSSRTQDKDLNDKHIELDIVDLEKFREVIKKINPRIIIHCARLDPFDNDPLKAEEITKNLVKVINDFSIKLLYISTDAVFDGQKGNYKENDIPNPVTDYGKAKLAAENVIRNNGNNYIIIRTANIYGQNNGVWDKRINYLLDEINSQKIVYRFDDVYRSFTLVDNLAKSCWKLVNSDFNGTINITGDRKSFFNFSNEIVQKLKVNSDLIKGISFKENNTNIAIDTSLDTSLAKSLNLL